jgi:hypothetical protein
MLLSIRNPSRTRGLNKIKTKELEGIYIIRAYRYII